jgi:histidine triad (HIT) family protein
MDDCLFCKMVSGVIKPDVVFENDRVLAFRDIHPQAPVHVLIIPKNHVATANDLTDGGLAGELLTIVPIIAKQLGIADEGYRIAINCNQHGGQAVYHLHLHLLGGRQMGWPPG